MQQGFSFQLPSVCGTCFLLLVLAGWILWLICSKIIKWTVADTTWYLRPARGLAEVETLGFPLYGVWLSVPSKQCRQISLHILSKGAEKTWWHVTKPPWGCSLVFDGNTAGSRSFTVAARAMQGAPIPWQCRVSPTSAVHGAGRNTPVWVCLSAAFWEQDVLLLLFLYALHRVETKSKYRHRVRQSLLTWEIDCNSKSSFFFLFLVFIHSSATCCR